MPSDTDVTDSLDANQLDNTAPAHDEPEPEQAAEAEANASTQLHAQALEDPTPSSLPKTQPTATGDAGLQATVWHLQETMERNMAVINAQMGFMMDQLRLISVPPNPTLQPTSPYGSAQHPDTPPAGRSTLRPTEHSVDRNAHTAENKNAGCPTMEPSTPCPSHTAGRPTLESSTPLQTSSDLLAHALASTMPLMDQTANSPANGHAGYFNMPAHSALAPGRNAGSARNTLTSPNGPYLLPQDLVDTHSSTKQTAFSIRDTNPSTQPIGSTHECAELNKAQNRKFRDHIIDGSNDPDNNNDNVVPMQPGIDGLEQIHTRHPHRKLFGMYDMKIADPNLHAELIGKKQYTTTPSLLHEWVSKKFPDANAELETALAGRGPLAAAAMAEYRETLMATLDCNIYVAVVMLMKAIATNPLRAQHLDAIIRLAVNMESPQSILDHVPKIKNSGMFDRSKSYHGVLEHSPSLQNFGYKQNGQANMWWHALGQLVITWWGWNPASNTDQEQAEHKWLSAKGGGLLVQTLNEPIEGLIAREEQSYQDRVDAAYGKSVCTDDQRIKNLLQAAEPRLQRSLKIRLSLKNKQVHNLQWNEFVVELEQAGNAPNDLFLELHGCQP